eukprot:133743_1
MPSIVLPAFGGRFFANCNDNDTNCEYDFITFNFYQSMFLTLGGAMAFIFAGFIGSLSDSLGRKPFLLMATFFNLLTYSLLILRPSIWIYWILTTLTTGFFGNITTLSALETSYIDDITLPDQKLIGFTIAIGFMASAILIGSLIATTITVIFDILMIFIVMAAAYLILTIYTLIFLPETIKYKTKFICKQRWNIIKPLFYLTSNPIILWISIISMLISVGPISIAVLLVYLNDQINVNNDDQSAVVNLSVFATLSLSSGICAGFIVPILKSKCNISNISLCIIGILMMIIANLLFSIIAFITDENGDNSHIFIYCIALIVFATVWNGGLAFVFPATRSIVALTINQKQKGVAFGIVRAYGSITSIIAPFTFGLGYNYTKEYLNFPSLIFYVIAGLLFIALIVVICPLRRAVKELQKNNIKYSFSAEIMEQSALLMDKTTEYEHSKTVNSYDGSIEITANTVK